jgi:hypothetical protein
VQEEAEDGQLMQPFSLLTQLLTRQAAVLSPFAVGGTPEGVSVKAFWNAAFCRA